MQNQTELLQYLERIASHLAGIDESLHTIAAQFEAATPLASLARRENLKQQLGAESAAELDAITVQEVAALRQVTHLIPGFNGGVVGAVELPAPKETLEKRKSDQTKVDDLKER